MKLFRKKKAGKDEQKPLESQLPQARSKEEALPATVHHLPPPQEKKAVEKKAVEKEAVEKTAVEKKAVERRDSKRQASPAINKSPPQQREVQELYSKSHSDNKVDSTKGSEEDRNEITRELVKKFVADIWNRGDLELIPEVCSKSLRFNGSVGMDRVGHDGFAR